MKHHKLFMGLKKRVSVARGDAVIVTRDQLQDVLPHYWREERVATPEEWFIRMGRGLGFHITHRADRDFFVVRATVNAADEATITWPGKAA